MTNVLMVTRPISPPWNEGSKNTAWLLARSIKGFQFNLFTVQGMQTPEAPNVHWEPIYRSARFSLTQKLRMAVSLVQRREVDIVHCLFVPTMITSLFLSRVFGVYDYRSIQTVPSLPDVKLTRSVAGRIFFADQVVTLSKRTCVQLCELGIENVKLIRPGIDIFRFSESPARAEIREPLEIPINATVAIFSGELSRLGSVEILLKALPEILTRVPDLFVVLASPTRLQKDQQVRETIVQFIRREGFDNRVRILGDVESFPMLLQACNIFLFPVQTMSGKIDVPLTLLEAMAAGLPVVLSNVPPLDEISREGVCISVQPHDASAFIDAVVALAHSREKQREVGRRGSDWVRENYSAEQMAASYAGLYEQLATYK